MSELTIGSLCTGYGGLDLAVEQHYGARTVWVSDVDKNANLIIDQRFPGVPNLGDLTVLDWSQVPAVDILIGGYPCQPFSQAGKREGTKDVRHIWPHIRDAVATLRPRVCVFENVQGHLSLGGTEVIASLAALGVQRQVGVGASFRCRGTSPPCEGLHRRNCCRPVGRRTGARVARIR